MIIQLVHASSLPSQDNLKYPSRIIEPYKAAWDMGATMSYVQDIVSALEGTGLIRELGDGTYSVKFAPPEDRDSGCTDNHRPIPPVQKGGLRNK